MLYFYLKTLLKWRIYFDSFITKRNKWYICISDGAERHILESRQQASYSGCLFCYIAFQGSSSATVTLVIWDLILFKCSVPLSLSIAVLYVFPRTFLPTNLSLTRNTCDALAQIFSSTTISLRKIVSFTVLNFQCIGSLGLNPSPVK